MLKYNVSPAANAEVSTFSTKPKITIEVVAPGATLVVVNPIIRLVTNPELDPNPIVGTPPDDPIIYTGLYGRSRSVNYSGNNLSSSWNCWEV